MSHDAQFADHRFSPYFTERSVRDVNNYQAACESVADRLFMSRAPEFVSWLQGRTSDQDLAEMVVAIAGNQTQAGVARFLAKAIRTEWTSYVCSGPDSLRNEIRREL